MCSYLRHCMKNLFFRDELGLILKYESKRVGKSTLIDVGAATGDFAVPFAKKGWRIVAFEPEPNNYAILKKNLNKFEDVICIPKAVSDTSGEVPFYVSSRHGGIHSLKPFHPTHRPTARVKVVRLDDALADLRVEQISILKVDIEGADFLALKSFNFYKFRPDVVMCEFMDSRSFKNFGYTHHDVATFMSNHGYVAFVSEWGAMVEYASNDRLIVPPKFLCCAPYPLDHSPAFGNLIFVPSEHKDDFQRAIFSYFIEWKLSNILVRTLISCHNFLSDCIKKTRGSKWIA